MRSLLSQLESILFVASKPLSTKRLAEALAIPLDEMRVLLGELRTARSNEDSGVMLLQAGDEWQMVAHAENRLATEQFLKAEISGELTKAQLETLTVISYCGPITRPEIEQLRGVNCSVILRNLLLRGLIKEVDGEASALVPSYEVTVEYLRHLGITALTELPEYETLHHHPYIQSALLAGE